MEPKRALPKWLLITFISVAVIGAGFFAWWFLLGPGKKVATTATPVVTDVTAGWLTYTNNTYGFSFKYPKDWKASDDNKGYVSLTDTAKSYPVEGTDMAPIVVQYATDKSGADINKYLSTTLKAILKTETTKIDSRTAYTVQGATPPNYQNLRIVFDNNNVYTFVSNGISLKAQDPTSSINTTFNQLLKTVKFTTPVTTTKTTTTTTTTTTASPIIYTNGQYGFNFTMPATWAKYKIKTATYDGEVATLYIEMPTTDSSPASVINDDGYYSPFAISVYTPDQWAAVVAAEAPVGTKITQTAQYVFSWSHANGIPASDWILDSDVAAIIASFKAN